MDQIRIGRFLKELRKEKGLTQEQMAERLNVSSRTISRWETGSNMPDVGMLAELAEFFDVSMAQIIDAERKSGEMNGEMKEEERKGMLKIADYSQSERNALMKKVFFISLLGFVALTLALLLESGMVESNPLLMCIQGACFGLASGALMTCMLFTLGVLSKIKNNRRAKRTMRIIGSVCLMILAACLVVCAAATMMN